MTDPFRGTYKCDSCGETYNDATSLDPGSRWRWNGKTWEHKCPDAHPQAGHFQAALVQEAEASIDLDNMTHVLFAPCHCGQTHGAEVFGPNTFPPQEPVEAPSDGNQFGKAIRTARRAKDLTQSDLAETIGVDFTYISKIENNRLPYPPADDTIRLIAETLDLNAETLLIASGRTMDVTYGQWAEAQARIKDLEARLRNTQKANGELVLMTIQEIARTTRTKRAAELDTAIIRVLEKRVRELEEGGSHEAETR